MDFNKLIKIANKYNIIRLSILFVLSTTKAYWRWWVPGSITSMSQDHNIRHHVEKYRPTKPRIYPAKLQDVKYRNTKT